MEISGHASYVRNRRMLQARYGDEPPPESIEQASDVTPPEANQRIWELLETPQTVETIVRVLRNEFDLPPAACTEGVKIVLARLYHEDLIQLSPDT